MFYEFPENDRIEAGLVSEPMRISQDRLKSHFPHAPDVGGIDIESNNLCVGKAFGQLKVQPTGLFL